MFQKYLTCYFLSLIIFILICSLILPFLLRKNINFTNIASEFIWPTPNYFTITSKYGPRKAPAGGASTFHTGIDIGAPEGSTILSICDGYVSFTGFKGAGGYTITVSSPPYQISYCHLNPEFEVFVSEFVYKGEKIAKVGPKYIEKTANNPYTDSTGNSTNGATTGPHLHLTIREDGSHINPLQFFPNINY